MLKRYRCHKVVEAGRIVKVEQGRSVGSGDPMPFWSVTVEGEGLTRWLEGKHVPEVGGYFVRYEDGYTSYSPAAAFEAGYTEIRRIGAIDWAADVVERIARVCHAANREYALAVGEDPALVYPEWAAAPAEIRESARVGVRAALNGSTPEQLHESWMATKVADGWIYGLTRDNRSKVHPCLVPYDQLPVAQRRKDALFQAIVAALAG